MRFAHEINRLLVGILVTFGIVSISAAYWSIVGPDTILRRDDNPRLVEAEASIIRGDIVDRHGELLVTSITNADGTVSRRYLHPETSSALGYFSLRYGVGGAEAAYDRTLRGDDLDGGLAAFVDHGLLHKPQVGSNVRLTLDLNVQQQVFQALNGRTGAAVVMSVPDGAVLALISLPTYDANTLDAEWETLINAPGKPFFSRVVQGSYQPGGMLETPLMAAALLSRQPLEAVIDEATTPVQIAEAVLKCAAQPPSTALTLSQSYVFGCPYPFTLLASQLGRVHIQMIFESFGLNQPPTLDGFVSAPLPAATPQATVTPAPSDDLQAFALGQSQLTVTPLGIAMIAAAILNDGNAPPPMVLLEIQRPGEANWIPSLTFRPTIPMTTAQAAGRLRDLLRDAVANGAARRAARPGLDIGGHAALSYSGEGSQAWFMGFAQLDSRKGVVVAVVVENSDDPTLAADIGGTALAAGSAALRDDQA